jgi:hypothetical protein
LTYLTDINGSHKTLKRDFLMARYTAKVWTSHAALPQAPANMIQMVVGFLTEEVTFERWAHLYQANRSWDIDPGPPRGSRLYYACLAGLLAPVRDLIDNGADINVQCGGYGNTLQAALAEGY